MNPATPGIGMGWLNRILRLGVAAVAWILAVGALPALAQTPIMGATQVVGGIDHTCALVNGGVKCWGGNSSGQLGDRTTTFRLNGVDVMGLTSGVTAIAAGAFYTCAVTSGGGVKCWGDNRTGQLGDGTTTQRLAPVDVIGLTSGVIAISAGRASVYGPHTCALTSTGGVKCWGANLYGEAPVDVIGLTSGVVAIAAGRSHTCAVTSSGGVKCWGDNNYGQLGDGTTAQRLTPVDVIGLTSGVTAIAAGELHTCAITSGGRVKCWGENLFGNLGDATTTNRAIPVDVIGLSSGVTGIAAGQVHTCGLMSGGGVKCWGDNRYGQLGDGTLAQRLTAVDVIELSSGVMAIGAGESHNCGLMSGGGVKCWGANDDGQLGNRPTGQRQTAVDVRELTSGVMAITAGGDVVRSVTDSSSVSHSCALTVGGGVKCWGNNSYGQLGNGTGTDQPTPVDVIGLSSGVKAIAAGSQHTCALTVGGGVKCWGNNSYGQLGNGTGTDQPTPVDVIGLSSGVKAIAAGSRHTCALTSDGAVRCWGGNSAGEYLSGQGSGATAITAGFRYTCALTSGGGVKCWGDNSYGQLGDNTITYRGTPTDVSGLTSGVLAISAGRASVYGPHTCALTSTGAVKCWGDNRMGQLGDGTTTSRTVPVDVIGLTSGVMALAAGDGYTCAVTVGGGVKCWGDNYNSKLGDGTTTSRKTPVDVLGLSAGMTAIAAGRQHTCALTNAGGVKCWGSNLSGELGDGTTDYGTPFPVIALQAPVAAGADVFEFYNTVLDHYFITADAGEAAAIDTGSAGPGWTRTGFVFKASGTTAVCRFYGSLSPGPNSHFYTADAAECAELKQLQAATPASQKRWNFESMDFLTTAPIQSAAGTLTCPSGMTPVYRAYNKGFTRGVDSNHRITGSQLEILKMVERGWTNEGVVMCTPYG